MEGVKEGNATENGLVPVLRKEKSPARKNFSDCIFQTFSIISHHPELNAHHRLKPVGSVHRELRTEVLSLSEKSCLLLGSLPKLSFGNSTKPT